MFITRADIYKYYFKGLSFLNTPMYATPQPLSAYLDTPLDCACGHTHYASLRCVSIRSGAVEDLPSILQKLGRSHPYLICDSVTR